MGKVRVAGFGVSLDGFGAGPEQSLEHPLGQRGKELHDWFFPTRTFRAMVGQDGGTEGVEAALAQARAAAGDLDVKIGGGVSTVRQYLLAGAVDELHLALSPVVLGRGEPLFAGVDLPDLGYRVTEAVPTELATHLVLTR